MYEDQISLVGKFIPGNDDEERHMFDIFKQYYSQMSTINSKSDTDDEDEQDDWNEHLLRYFDFLFLKIHSSLMKYFQRENQVSLHHHNHNHNLKTKCRHGWMARDECLRRSYCARLIFDMNAVSNVGGGSSASDGDFFRASHWHEQSVNRKANRSWELSCALQVELELDDEPIRKESAAKIKLSNWD